MQQFFERENGVNVCCISQISVEQISRGGGGRTQMLFGRGCAAEASKPVPIFKRSYWRKSGTHYQGFGGKGYPLLGIFTQDIDVFVYC